MGRLENFIPKCHILTFKEIGEYTHVSLQGQPSIEIPTPYIPFIKQMTGHLSLREILLFLDGKGKRVSIREALATVHQLTSNNFLSNGDEFLRAFDADPESNSSSAMTKNVNASTFSRDRLLGLIQKTTLFMSCEKSTAEKILKNSTLENLAAKTRVTKLGSKDNWFYILLSGEVGVYQLGRHLADLTPLSVFGESAAIFDRARNADVFTNTECWLLKINAAKLMDTSSAVDFDLYGSLKSRLILNQTLSSNPLFASVPTAALQLFLSQCQLEKHPKERMILKQNSVSKDFYFILKGSVTVLKDGIPVTSLSEGDHFGEVSAIYERPRSASIISELPCILLSLSGAKFYNLMCNHFHLAMRIEKTAKLRFASKENVFTKINNDLLDSALDSESLVNHQVSDEELIEYTGTSYDMPVLDFTGDLADDEGGDDVFELGDESGEEEAS